MPVMALTAIFSVGSVSLLTVHYDLFLVIMVVYQVIYNSLFLLLFTQLKRLYPPCLEELHQRLAGEATTVSVWPKLDTMASRRMQLCMACFKLIINSSQMLIFYFQFYASLQEGNHFTLWHNLGMQETFPLSCQFLLLTDQLQMAFGTGNTRNL